MASLFKNSGFWVKLMWFIVITIVFTMIFSVLTTLSASIIFGRENVISMSVEALQYSQSLLSVGIFIMPAVFFAFFFQDKNVFNALALNKAPRLKSLLISIALMVVSMPMVSFLEEINLAMKLPKFLSSLEDWMRSEEETAKMLTEKLLVDQTLSRYLINVLVIALIPAIGEELFFRATIQKNLLSDSANIRGWLCVVISAAVFSSGHLQFFGFLPRFLLGALLGFMLLYTKNLWVPVICHFFNNFMATTTYYIKSDDKVVEQSQFMEYNAVIILSALLTIFLVYLLAKIEKK